MQARVPRQREEQLDEAIRISEEALAIKRTTAEMMAYLASLYREKKEFPRAISRAREGGRDSNRPTTSYWFTLGAVYDEAKNKDRGHRA